MRAEVMAIGDELTSGARLDTNSQWLAQRLQLLGIPVTYHTTVSDSLDEMVSALRVALERADVIVLSGGLGPTADDLTRQALATVAGRRLIADAAVLEHIRALFARRGRVMPERNAVQAEFPEGSDILPNPHGTAPGIHLALAPDEGSSRHMFALPGVPAELKQMWTDPVEPWLERILGPARTVIRQRTIHCFGAGESDIEQRLPDLIRRGREPTVGITASRATISLRITARGTSEKVCQDAIAPTVATIHQCLGNLVFGEGNDQLQDVVVRMLQARRWRLATAECGTRGLVASWLAGTAHGGAYRGGIVVDSLDTIGGRPSVDASDASTAVRQQRDGVTALAQHVRTQLGADLGLAIGPAPSAAQGDGESPRIEMALATPRTVVPYAALFASHPALQHERSAKEALNFLRLWLLEQPERVG
jgi:nicotinamide-nucleotide amidase